MWKWLYDKLHPKNYEVDLPLDTGQLALKAIAEAQADLREAYARRPHVETLVRESELQTARNGFGAMVDASMERRS